MKTEGRRNSRKCRVTVTSDGRGAAIKVAVSAEEGDSSMHEGADVARSLMQAAPSPHSHCLLAANHRRESRSSSSSSSSSSSRSSLSAARPTSAEAARPS